MSSRPQLRYAVIAITCVLASHPSTSAAETVEASPHESAWLFLEAWRSFRYDFEASLPGGHGEVLLIHRLRNEPPWLLRDAIRLSAVSEVQTVLARHAEKAAEPERMIPTLRQALSDAVDEASRSAFERALIVLGDKSALAVVEGRLASGSYQERLDAAMTLESAGRQGKRALVRAMTTADPITELAAAAGLARTGHKGARRALAKALESDNAYHEAEAAHALAASGDSRSVPVLLSLLKSPGADQKRVLRSLATVGGPGERTFLLDFVAKLPWGPRLPLRREALIAVGDITTRVELTKLREPLGKLEARGEYGAEVRSAWLEAIGYAASQRARGQEQFVEHIEKTVEREYEGEGEVAFLRRRGHVASLVEAVRSSRWQVPEPEIYTADRAALVEWLRIRRSDVPEDRERRFDAAVALLAALGAELGHGSKADPPEVCVAGLGGHRAVDGNFLTSWFVGAMTGPLQLELTRPVPVKSLLAINGCVESRRAYQDHPRVKKLRVILESGKRIEASLADGRPYFQRVELPGELSKTITVEVIETYPGKRAGAPACVPELRLEH